jgi:hypothetical protein
MLERELRELQVEWPETPDLAAAVAARLPAAPAPVPRRRWRWLDRPAWQLGIAVTAALIAIVMAVPPARSAVLELLGLRSVKIERKEPQPSRFGSDLALGTAVSLDRARRRFPPLVIPAEVGAPDSVYLDEHPAFGTRVDLVYRARPGLRRASTLGAGLLVTELRASLEPVIEKTIGSATKLERLRVDGDPAYFISGAEHGFAYVPTDGTDPVFEDQRLAGTTLLVERSDGLLLRIEGRLSRAQAVRIAESAR